MGVADNVRECEAAQAIKKEGLWQDTEGGMLVGGGRVSECSVVWCGVCNLSTIDAGGGKAGGRMGVCVCINIFLGGL